MYFKQYISLLHLVLLPVFLLAQDIPEGGDNILGREEITAMREKKMATELFFDANKAKLTDNLDKAFTLFKECVEKDPYNDAAWYELSRIYYDRSEMPEAIEAAAKAYALTPENTWYSLSLAALYENNGQDTEALKIYEILYKADPANTEHAIDLANVWIKLNKPNEAIRIYNEMEARLGINEELSMRKHRIYLATGKSKKALEELEKLAQANSWDSRILSMLAEYYILEGKNDEALKIYHKIQEVDPDNAYIDISLADFYRQRGEMDKATESLKKGFANPYLDADTKIQVMMSYFSQAKEYPGMQKDVADLAAILAIAHPNEPRVMMLYGEILMVDENYKKAKEILTAVVQTDPGKYQVWENLLRCSAILEEYEDLDKNSLQTIELFPLQPIPYYFNGVANYMLKNYEQAVKSLKAGVKIIAGDKNLTSDFYSLIGDAHHSAGENDASFEAYELSLKANPDNALVLNNYAYHLSLAAVQLEKASQMAQKAVVLSPGNSYYLDTYAWVLYKQGNYTEALNYIEQSMKFTTDNSATVMEHYGDILYRLNRKEEASVAWKKALEKGEGSAFLESKVKEGKLNE